MTTFSTNTGFNSIAIEALNETYFSLISGLNSVAIGLDVSVGRVFFQGVAYTGNINVTIESVQGSYTYTAIAAPFTIYPYTDSLCNIIEHTITVTASGLDKTLVLIPDPSGFIDFELEIVKCISRDFANRLNPFSFRSSGFDIGFEIGEGCPPFCDDASGLGCNYEYIREKRLNMPVLIAGDELSFMLNLDVAINYSGYKVALLDGSYNFAMQNIALNTIDNGDGTYTYYSSFTVPCLPTGCYYIAIYNTLTNTAVYVSRAFKEANLTNWRENTRLLKYRNSFDLGGFKFETIPTFYQQIRLDINQSSYSLASEKTSYREQSTKSIRNIQSTTDKNIVFKTFQFDEDLHDAMSLAFDCDEIFLNDIQYRSFEAYQVNQDEGEDLTNGSIELYQVGFSYSSKSC